MKITVSKNKVWSFFVLFSCFNIESINFYFPFFSNITFILRLALIVVFILLDILNKRRRSNVLLVISAMCLFILGMAVFNGGDLLYVAKSLTLPYVIAYYADTLRNSSAKLLEAVLLWRNILVVLLAVDLLTIVIFRGGMYSTEAYTDNWFLGYKTARLHYLLPLCVFEEIRARLYKKDRANLLVYAAVLIDILLSRATGAFLTTGFAVVLMLLSRNTGRLNKRQTFIRCILNYKLFIPLYAVVTGVTILANNTPEFARLLALVGKDPTLTTRTMIWENAVKLIGEKPVTGYGLWTPEQYREAFNSVFFSNPHNMILSLLMIGGVVFLALYVITVVMAWRKASKNPNVFVCTVGIMAILFVGITSSAMIFSLPGFLFFTMSYSSLLKKQT